MAIKSLSQLSGKVRTRAFSRLDSDRYRFLELSQAEPNPGLPDSDNALFVSQLDGTRSFTTSPILSGLSFKDQGAVLDSSTSTSLLVLDSNGFVAISSANDIEKDTLEDVTLRGDSTSVNITVGSLTSTGDITAKGGDFSANVSVGGNVAITGNLQVDGTTTTINTDELTVTDKTITVASGAPDAATADSSGIIVDGAGASILYRNTQDRFLINKGIEVGGNLFIGNVDTEAAAADGLFIDGDGKVVTRPIETGDPELIAVRDVETGTTFPVLAGHTSGADSAFIDTVLVYDVDESKLTTGRLVIDVVNEGPNGTKLLVHGDSDGDDEVRFRNVSDILSEVQSADTLQDVVSRGDSANRIQLESLDILDSVSIAGNLKVEGQLLDGQLNRLVIYDSALNVLWG